MNALDLLSAANPEPAEAAGADLDARACADLARILSEDAPRVLSEDAPRALAGRRRGPTRRALLAGAAAMTGAGLLGVAVIDRRRATPALAVTPPPLVLTPLPGTTEQAFATLITRAEAASGEPARAASWSAWSLWTRIGNDLVQSAVVPTDHELTWAADGSGHLVTRWGRAWTPVGAPADLPVAEGDVESDRTYAVGEFPPYYTTAPPTLAPEMYRYLSEGHPIAEQGTPELLVAIKDLLRQWRLGPSQRAAILRLLRDTGHLSLAGSTADRRGRGGWAFTLDHEHGGLPKKTTLIVSPRDGAILASEDMLTTTPGKLNVSIPAVIGYECFGT